MNQWWKRGILIFVLAWLTTAGQAQEVSVFGGFTSQEVTYRRFGSLSLFQGQSIYDTRIETSFLPVAGIAADYDLWGWTVGATIATAGLGESSLRTFKSNSRSNAQTNVVQANQGTQQVSVSLRLGPPLKLQTQDGDLSAGLYAIAEGSYTQHAELQEAMNLHYGVGGNVTLRINDTWRVSTYAEAKRGGALLNNEAALDSDAREYRFETLSAKIGLRIEAEINDSLSGNFNVSREYIWGAGGAKLATSQAFIPFQTAEYASHVHLVTIGLSSRF